jgi:hypothetical protein
VDPLLPLTTYYIRVRAKNANGVLTVFDQVVSTRTRIGAPDTPFGSALGISSVSWTWNPVPGAASYRIYTATSAGFSLIGSSTWAFFVHGSIPPNNPSQIYVSAVDAVTGLEGSRSSNGVAVYTYANLATSLVATTADQDSISLQWARNGNPIYGAPYYMYQSYEISYSTSNDFMGVISTNTMYDYYYDPVSWMTPNGLLPASTYYFRVRAINQAGLYSAFSAIFSTPTTLGPPTGLSCVDVQRSSASWVWDPVAGATGYSVFSSTGRLGSTTSPAFIHRGLAPNTLNTFYVRAVDFLGRDGDLISRSTYTLSNPPTDILVVAVDSFTVTLDWSLNGNPQPYWSGAYYPGQYYQLNYSTNSDFSAPTGTQTASSNIPNSIRVTYAATQLLSETTYYFRTRAFNTNGYFSEYGTVVSTPTSIPAPTGIYPSLIAATTIQWTWNPLSGAQGYRIYDGGVLVGTTGQSAGFIYTGRSPDTLNTITVKGIDFLGRSGSGSSASTRTYANPPTQSVITGVSAQTISLQWNTNGNWLGVCCYSGGTFFEVSRSSFSDFSMNVATVTVTPLGYTVINYTTPNTLQPSTTYYIRVRAKNQDGIYSAFDATQSAVTNLPAATGLSAVSVGTDSVSWVWDSVPGAVSYGVYLNNSLFLGSTSSPNYLLTGLNPNTFVNFSVRAIDFLNRPEVHQVPQFHCVIFLSL